MDFKTTISILPFKNKIQHQHQLMMLGSCFSESIGECLQRAKFAVDINPFGIQYNPLSVAASLERIIEQQLYSSKELFQYNEQWHSYGHHSRFSSDTAEDCLQHINSRIEEAASIIMKADYLFITFGTAWVYELKENGNIVSNCHKLPDKEFVRRRLTVEEIVLKYTSLLQQLHAQNPKLQMVFTVSPIRHWKDGAHENNISKSILLLAIDKLNEALEYVSYFPSYELLLDDLRDYRFYSEDMLHPNSTAIDYIWSRFSECYFSDETKSIALEMNKMSRALAHRPFNTKGEEYKKFCKKQFSKMEQLEKKYPDINFKKEKLQIDD